MGTRLILVGGGARSGKSRVALELALARGGRRGFIAMAEAHDDEMRARIAAHRAERGGDFETLEAPHALAEAIATCDGHDVVLVDCLTLWLSNRLLADVPEATIARELDAALDAATALRGPCIVVTNEVGMGLVPETPLGRAFRDLAGRCHQRIAARADAIHFAALGTVLRLHPGPVELARRGPS